jgi:hypothetical protein
MVAPFTPKEEERETMDKVQALLTHLQDENQELRNYISSVLDKIELLEKEKIQTSHSHHNIVKSLENRILVLQEEISASYHRLSRDD